MKSLLRQLRWSIGSLSLGAILLFGITSVSVSFADDDDRKEYREYGKSERHEREDNHFSGFRQNKVYLSECNSCHIAYPPNLLPAASWTKIMGGLEDHFGENAETDKQTVLYITNYLRSQALPIGRRSKWSRMLRNMKNKAPLRITQLPYFKHEHDDIPTKMVKNNPEVVSFSQCNACHKDAEKGMFDEHSVNIPNYGRWED